ncbi:MAG: Gfo/Idh/MocA family protein [Chitinophagales bacterium]
MEEQAKIKVGVIGAGAIAEHCHLDGYSRLKDVEIAALADIDPRRLAEMAERFSVGETYSDWRELVARPDLAAVSICTPNYLHAEMAIAAAEAGKHVLCEKPMAVTVEEAARMKAAAERAGVKLMVGFTHRYFKHNQVAKRLLEEGVIGQPLIIRCRFAHDGPYNSWSAKTDWFFDPVRAGGGALLDMGIHAIDLMRYFMGDIVSVSGTVANVKKPIQVEDTALGIYGFESGAVGYMEVSWSSLEGILGVELYGTEGSLVIDYTTPLKVYTEKGTGAGPKGWVQPVDCQGGGWTAEMAHFVECLREDKAPLTGADEGIAGLRAALATYESAASGRRIDLSSACQKAGR